MERTAKENYCINNINKITQLQRENIGIVIYNKLDHGKIDNTNTIGMAIYMSYFSDELLDEIYTMVKSYIE